MPAIKLRRGAPAIGGKASATIALLQAQILSLTAQLAACQARTIQDLIRAAFPTEIAAVTGGTSAAWFLFTAAILQDDSYTQSQGSDPAAVSLNINAPLTSLGDLGAAAGGSHGLAKHEIRLTDLAIQHEWNATNTNQA